MTAFSQENVLRAFTLPPTSPLMSTPAWRTATTNSSATGSHFCLPAVSVNFFTTAQQSTSQNVRIA
jgi:hypothetical protein